MRLIRVTNPKVMDEVEVIGSTTEQKENVREELRGLMENFKNNCFVQVAISGTEEGQNEKIEAWSFSFAPLDADFVLCAQAHTTPEGSKQRMPDKMLLRGIQWALMHGRTAIRMITERNDQPFMRRWGFEVESYTMRLPITDEFEDKLINRLQGDDNGIRQPISELNIDGSTEGRTLGTQGHLHGEDGLQDRPENREDGKQRTRTGEQQRVRKSATLASDVTVPIELGIDRRLRERKQSDEPTGSGTYGHPKRETVESVVERLDAELLREGNSEPSVPVVQPERGAEDSGGVREHGSVLLKSGSSSGTGKKSDAVGPVGTTGTADVQRQERPDSAERVSGEPTATRGITGESDGNVANPSGTRNQSSAVPNAKQG